MNLIPLIRHLPLVFRIGSFLNIGTGQLDSFLLYSSALSWTAVVLSQAYTMEWRRQEIPIRPIYECLAFTCDALHVPFLLRNRHNLALLVRTLLQPLHDFEMNHLVASQETVTGVFRFGTMCYLSFVVCCVAVGLWPLFALPFYSEDTSIQDLPLPVGRIPFHTESYFVYTVAYVMFFFALMTGCMLVTSSQLVMMFAIFRMRTQSRLLVDSLESLEQRAQHRLAQGGSFMGQGLDRCDHDCLVESVQNHVEIIAFVRLFNSCFRSTLLILFNTLMLIIAAVVFQAVQIFKSGRYNKQDLFMDISLCVLYMIMLGVFNYSGQTIVNESVRLNHALYHYKWLTKPKSFKTSLLIMKTVATRPLQLTVGGLYPLCLETHRNVMQAVYSYINVLLSMQKNK